MARFLGLSILLAVVLYGIWPYYSLFRINNALQSPDAQALAPVVDLVAIQRHFKARIESGVDSLLPLDQNRQPGSSQSDRSAGSQHGRQSNLQDALQLDADKVLGWLAGNLKQLGDAALDQAITLDWVRSTLLAAARRADSEAGPQGDSRFIAAVDFAFFEGWNRFVIRLGRLGESPTFVILTLDGADWRVTDITH
ncbi:DUF2939 domain-containing protein [Halochromatium roseum]|uniref:DUF2939 domain-containing protein n=1 Tax=Halochromatium roseum TaxID=391920 RepID=UPI00191205FB|nr:DUF2939 domain-containing protein [Halochromatium roseum]MBK5941923.1 hypothetical protein [Halochromatium roseum]